MRMKLNSKDVIWSYIGTVLSMTSNLLMLPIIIYYLDEDMLGLWYVFTSLGAIATLFDCGFSITFSRNITYCWSGAKELRRENVSFVDASEPNFVLMKRVIETCKSIYLIISATALAFLLLFGTLYIRRISSDIVEKKFYIAWVIYAVAIFLNLYYGYYAAFLRGVGAIKDANINTVVARSAQIVVTIVSLICGAGIIGVCSAYLVYGTLFRFLGKKKFYRYKNIGSYLNNITIVTTIKEKKELFFIVWHNAWRDGLISLTDYCCNQVSSIICSMYLSLSETGTYSLGIQLATAISMISGTLYTAYQPTLQEAYINEDKKKQKDTMALIIMTFVYIFILGTVGTAVVGLPVLKLIKPNSIVTVDVFVVLCIYQFLLRFRNCFTSFFSCTNRIPYVKSFVASACLCIILSYFSMGVLGLGIWGLIVAQIVSQMVFNVWYWPMKVLGELKINIAYIILEGTKQLKTIIKNLVTRKRVI